MTMMVAVPAVMMMVRMSDFDDNLGVRYRYQRSKENKSEKAKTKFLHNYSDAQSMRQVVVRCRPIVIACAIQNTKMKIRKATS
jgi:hypothetical protein